MLQPRKLHQGDELTYIRVSDDLCWIPTDPSFSPSGFWVSRDADKFSSTRHSLGEGTTRHFPQVTFEVWSAANNRRKLSAMNRWLARRDLYTFNSGNPLWILEIRNKISECDVVSVIQQFLTYIQNNHKNRIFILLEIWKIQSNNNSYQVEHLYSFIKITKYCDLRLFYNFFGERNVKLMSYSNLETILVM